MSGDVTRESTESKPEPPQSKFSAELLDSLRQNVEKGGANTRVETTSRSHATCPGLSDANIQANGSIVFAVGVKIGDPDVQSYCIKAGYSSGGIGASLSTSETREIDRAKRTITTTSLNSAEVQIGK